MLLFWIVCFMFVLFVFLAFYLCWKEDHEALKLFEENIRLARMMEADKVIFPKEPYSGISLVKSDENE